LDDEPSGALVVDAFYVELAEQLDAPIITTDKRLAAAVPQAELPP